MNRRRMSIKLDFNVRNMLKIIFLIMFFINSFEMIGGNRFMDSNVQDSTYVTTINKLIIKDTSLFQSMDSLITNSICPRERIRTAKFILIFCVKHSNSYEFCVEFEENVFIGSSLREQILGCFMHKNKTVLLIGDMPPDIVEVSETTSHVEYQKSLSENNHEIEFSFSYIDGFLGMIYILCM